jgi:predicted Zn-dependent protease
MMRTMLPRVALLAVAVLVLGWLAVLYRDHRIVADVSPGLISDTSLSAGEFDRDARRLERAAFLNPDPTWRLNLGFALTRHDRRRALRELERLVASEPDNLAAWRIVLFATGQVDRPLAARARAQIKRLDPLSRP